MLWPDHCVRIWMNSALYTNSSLTVMQVQGTKGAEIHSDIQSGLDDPARKDRVHVVRKVSDSLLPLPSSQAMLTILAQGMNKNIDAYDAFETETPPAQKAAADSPSYKSLLTQHLKAAAIERVYVVGLATDYCVRATALAAAKDGFDTYVVESAVRAVGGEEADKRVFAEFEAAKVKVIQRDAVKV